MIPSLEGKQYKVTQYLVNDDCNFFDEWQEDRKTYGITDDCFSWSPDDPTLDSTGTLSDAKAREIYMNELRDKYIECSELTPTETVVETVDGQLTLNIMLDANNVVFFEIEEIK